MGQKKNSKVPAKKLVEDKPITWDSYQRRHMTDSERRELKEEVDAELAIIRLEGAATVSR